MELTEHDSGSRITVRLGEPLILRLPEIGGTAFLWHLDEAAAELGLTLVTSTMEEAPDTPGGTGIRRLVVEAGREGVVELRLTRHRPWEDGSEADAEFVLTLEVTQQG